MPKQKVTNKERRLYFAGAAVGIVGGILGNLWVTYVFRFADNPGINNWVNGVAALIFTIILFGTLYLINKQIKKNK